MRNGEYYLAVVAAELEAQGHLTKAGKRYALTAISRMLASPIPPSGKGFIIGGQSPRQKPST